jgi:hypothetical protein
MCFSLTKRTKSVTSQTLHDMKVVSAKPNSKRKIRSLPITGNYLVRESNGMLRWAEPNDSWRLYAHTGQQRCLIANIRYDDTEHSPDLWIYTILKSEEMKPVREVHRVIGREPKPSIEGELIADNRIYLNRSRKWYVRQFLETERVGIRRFTGLPLNAFWAMWRRTISLDDIQIYGLSNKQMKIVYAGLNFNVFLKWPELQYDIRESDSFMTQNKVQWIQSQSVMPWLHANCQGGFIPFSDYDVMFPDDMDETTYTIDVA